jgi:hypothetical protein
LNNALEKLDLGVSPVYLWVYRREKKKKRVAEESWIRVRARFLPSRAEPGMVQVVCLRNSAVEGADPEGFYGFYPEHALYKGETTSELRRLLHRVGARVTRPRIHHPPSPRH